MKITYTIEKYSNGKIYGYVAEVNEREIWIDRWDSFTHLGTSYKEINYSVYESDLMTERRLFNRLSDAKKFVAELIGA
jgi:hypothetical protein